MKVYISSTLYSTVIEVLKKGLPGKVVGTIWKNRVCTITDFISNKFSSTHSPRTVLYDFGNKNGKHQCLLKVRIYNRLFSLSDS